MITVDASNVSKKPLELGVSISYKTLIKALKQLAKEKNMPLEIAESKYDIENSWKSYPCVAVYHTKHKWDYHCAVIELKEAYGEHYAYIHLGGSSKNQRNANFGKSFTYVNSQGEIAQRTPGFLGRLFGSEGEAGLKDEELYYDALYKTIGSALALAERWTVDPPEREPAPRPATATHARSNTATPQKSTPTDAPKSAPAPEKPILSELHKEAAEAEPRQKLEKSIGIETMGGVFYKIISAGTYIPTEASITFSTAADKQTSVEINVLQGENEKACDNISLGKYTLSGIVPAPRGVPEIEITFSVNKYGELDLTATDKGTDKELEIFVDNVLNASKEKQTPQPKKIVEQEKPQPTAAFPLCVSQSDEELMKWLDADISLLTADGTTTEVLKKETYLPHRKTVTLSLAADEQKAVDIQVIECKGSAPADRYSIGKLVLGELPYSIKGNLQMEFVFAIDSKGNTKVTVQNLNTKKYLPITFVPNQPTEPKMDVQKQPVQAEKNKVDQLKDLVDLLDRGALTQEEFEILKKKILYN